MPLSSTFASDYKLFDDAESASFVSVYSSGNTATALTGVQREELSQREVAAGAGLFQLGDQRFRLPAPQIPSGDASKPKPGDRVTVSGVTWEILDAVLSDLDLEWVCTCRRDRTPGPTVPPTESGDTVTSYSAENKGSATFAIGAALAVHSSGSGVLLAHAGSSPPRRCVGLASVGVAVGVAETVVTEGVFSLADWSAVTGSAALASGSSYYLDPATVGRLTATAPSSVGQIVQQVGRAVSTTQLDLEIEDPILL